MTNNLFPSAFCDVRPQCYWFFNLRLPARYVLVICLMMFARNIYIDLTKSHINLVHVHVVYDPLFSMVLIRVVHSGQHASPSVGMFVETGQCRVCCVARVSRRNASARERRASGSFRIK